MKQINRVLGVSRNTVRAALRSAGPPKYERAGRSSIVDEVEPRIRELLQAFPAMPATVIAERIGWSRSMTVLKARVAELRPVYLPPDPASRTAYVAGEIAQFDLWFPPISLPVGFGQTRPPTALPVLTMVRSYSRWAAAVLIPSRTAEDLVADWWQLLAGLGAVPRVCGRAAARLPRAVLPARRGLHRPGGLQRPRSARGWGWRTPGYDGHWGAPADRIAADREVIALKGDSYRLKDRDLGRSHASATEDP
jgi:hypothetical protein